MAISIQIFVYSLVCNRIFLRYSNVQSLAPKEVFRFFPKMLGDHNYELTLIIIDNSMSQFRQGNNLRLNAIIKDDQTIKVSIVANPRTTIAKLKRQIQQQLLELFSINLLVSVIEDSRGFVLSNNSTISEHCGNNQTVYLQIHKEKLGSNMNLPNNATDIFMTLRYVCSSVIKKLENLEISLDPIQVLPEILHIGFWYSNTEIVTSLCRFLNKILTTESIEQFYKKAHDIHNALLLKLFTFWFSEVRNSFAVFPDVGEELLSLLYKLSLNPNYAQLMRGSKILANIIELSKDQLISPQMKKASILTIKNINGKGLGMKTTSAYIPSALQQSNAYLSNIEQVLDKLSSSNQEQMASALTQLSQHPKLVAEACVRFDYFMKLCLIFNIKSVKDKTSIRAFNAVVKQIMSNITKQKAKEIMQKDIIRKLHNFLLESHPQAHPIVLEFYSIIAKESTTKGVFNIEQANEVLLTPYPQFQKITIESLSEMSEKQKQTSSIRFLPSIKDYIRLSLKTDSDSLSAGLIKILSNLTLDQQCRYQIINLKGIQIFVKLLEIGDKNGRSQLQRSCAKGLLNLSLSSRQTKAKILAQMTNVLQRFYKGSLDGVAGSYVQTLLKSNKV